MPGYFETDQRLSPDHLAVKVLICLLRVGGLDRNVTVNE